MSSYKDSYMMAFNILSDIEEFETEKLSADEMMAVEGAMDVLARLYTERSMSDIRSACCAEFFDDRTMAVIPAYHKAAEKGLSIISGKEDRS